MSPGAAGSSALIEAVRAWTTSPGGGDYYPTSEEVDHWIHAMPVASPLSRYAGYEHLGSWLSPLGAVAVEVCCADGVSGIGVAQGGHASCFVIEHGLVPLLLGADSREIEELWERMLLATAMFGAGGIALSAVSGVDLALWDLAGKRARAPVYQLLTPGASGELAVYATGPRPDLYTKAGFCGTKVSLPWGPTAGDEGLKANVDYLRARRAELEPGRFLAVDCLMALDLSYAERLVDATRDLELRWYEEPFLPWDMETLASLRRCGAPIASGEHNNHAELDRLIDAATVDVLQPDLTSCGGLTCGLRLADAAAKAGIECVPHCGGTFSYHLVASLGQGALAEFLFVSPDGADPVPTFGDLIKGEPLPRDGKISLSSAPGWGIGLADDGLERPYGGRGAEAVDVPGSAPR